MTTLLETFVSYADKLKPYRIRGGKYDTCRRCGQRFDQPNTGKGAFVTDDYWSLPEHIICCVSVDFCVVKKRGSGFHHEGNICGNKRKEFLVPSSDEAWSLPNAGKAFGDRPFAIPICGMHLAAYKRSAASMAKYKARWSANDLRELHGKAMSVYTKLAAQILEDVLDSVPSHTGLAVDPVELFKVMGIAVPQALMNAKADMEQYETD